MPPRELPSTQCEAGSPGGLSGAAPDSVAEDDELARAEARAEAARARANRLRRQADAMADDAGVNDEGKSPPTLHRPGRKALAAAAAIVLICVALTGSGFLVWHHHRVVRQRQRTAEFATAARNAVATMMSMDPAKARDEMQRFADNTTGLFKAGLLMGAEDAITALQQSNVSSKGSVQAAAVESTTEDSAVVLIAAKSEFSRPGQARPEPRSLRLVVTVQRDGGQIKIARLEFVP
jgi:Mce-associated membrane protein